ncbi:IS701 family transposase [Noviherbaspirillum galbum]|uniref:IS701 family transposase n=1 Tax=Noviherbaspirillum galbum TaxID=2709383 RepID=UPI001F30C8FE|nr:IS701 family transposase [Noviherbaspirillum galbum]
MDEVARQYVELGEGWRDDLECLFSYISPRFGRVDRQRHAWEYLLGLLSSVQRKNGWQLAEAVEHETPYSLQHLLDRAPWDADAVRDDLTEYISQELGDPNGVLVVDETGFLKKGTHSAGVQRQYSGTAGRIENCQVGVFMAYAGQHGRALMDRELYLPREWAEDEDRRQAAKIPDHIEFNTKPQLAQQMIGRAVAAKVPFAWITGDEVYGDNRSLRVWLEQNDLHFVLATRSNSHVWTQQLRQATVETLGNTVTEADWQTLSAGDGTKGPRWYDWVRIPLLSWQMLGERWLMLRRSRSDNKLAYYVCYVPAGTDLQTMVQVAGMRWMVEECFEAAKGEVGLDQYEVRSWHGWYRHITMAMLAHAFLAAECTASAEIDPLKKKPVRSRMEKWKRHRMRSSH